MNVLFIHRSVGNNLIIQGKLYEAFAQYSSDLVFSDFNQNNHVLRSSDHQERVNLEMPGGNTNPENYMRLFSEEASLMKDFVLQYDVVIIKSCYPNSNIKSYDDFLDMQRQYEAIAAFFRDLPETTCILLTTPPLRPSKTRAKSAHRALKMSEWLRSSQLADNFHVVDFFSMLADNSGRLRRRYRRLNPLDSHPNARANREAAPLVAQQVVRLITSR